MLQGGERLRPTSDATTVRVRDGEVLTSDGPFAETKEQIGGYFVVDCKDLDEAIEIASKIPTRAWLDRGEADLGDVSADVEAAVARAFRDEWGRVVATLIRTTGDWDLAEECAQDAFARALERWPRDGVPRNPGAWLTTTARNRAIDRLRRVATGAAKLQEVAVLSRPDQPADEPDAARQHDDDDSGVEDDRLRLIFTCCHPALSVDAQVALTLRTLAGLTTPEIARAFLVPEANHGAAPRSGEAQDPQRRDPVPRAAGASAAGADRVRCSACCTSCSTRGTRRPPAPTWCAAGCATRPSGSGAR